MASGAVTPSIVVSSCISLEHLEASEQDRPGPLNFAIYKKWKTMTSLRQASTPINVYQRTGSVDIEAGEAPGRIADSPRSSTASTSRLFAGMRRRRMNSETGGRTRNSLDEDLGFPPVCSPPPDLYSPGSVRTPVRSNSERAPAIRLRTLSMNEGVSGRHAYLQKKPSGILVVFPSVTPVNSPITGNEFFPPPPTTPTNSPSSGSIRPETMMMSSSRDSVTIRPSPRRPLFVDTQLANEKRSPVSSVMDFVRGRNRTQSLSHSISSPNTPVSPQAVSARGSASADAATMPISPLYSPGGRPLLGKQYRSAYRSLDSDSGLGLSSPSIGTTALLIKERALFQSFDSMTIGSSIAAGDCNTIFFDCQDAVYSLFMRAHKCYDLIPTSSKLVVFDTHLPVRKAFFALVYNGVRAAPLWDSDKQRFVGMLTITDFIKILIKHYEAGEDSEKMRALEEEEISHWRAQFAQDGCLRPLVAIDPNDSLHRAVQVLCESKVHRLPVLDSSTGNISYILTHKRIIKFLSLYMYDLPRPDFMNKTPQELGIGSWGDILTIHVDTPLHDALEIFLKNRVSALPLVDEEGKVVDIYAKFDVITLAAEKSYDKLDCTVKEALTHRSEWFEGVRTCSVTDKLFNVLENIVKAEVHRLIVTDDDKKVVGIIALSDILKYLVLDPVIVPSEPQSVCGEDSPIDGIPEANEDQ